jgi:hypothetical protein
LKIEIGESMATKTCFVIMGIGDQINGSQVVSSSELWGKYDSLIKEAILRAMPSLEVVRADEVSLPGSVTTDIISRLMHSDYVIADVTYPNPNVFYELGIRHASRNGTIIIRDKAGPRVPFDIAHLRYIEYENTTIGLKELASQLSIYFGHFEKNPDRPDNHFQEFAKLTGFTFPNYGKEEEPTIEMQFATSLLESPEAVSMLLSGQPPDQSTMTRIILQNPKLAQLLVQALAKSGQLSFTPKQPSIPEQSSSPKLSSAPEQSSSPKKSGKKPRRRN